MNIGWRAHVIIVIESRTQLSQKESKPVRAVGPFAQVPQMSDPDRGPVKHSPEMNAGKEGIALPSSWRTVDVDVGWVGGWINGSHHLLSVPTDDDFAGEATPLWDSELDWIRMVWTGPSSACNVGDVDSQRWSTQFHRLAERGSHFIVRVEYEDAVPEIS